MMMSDLIDVNIEYTRNILWHKHINNNKKQPEYIFRNKENSCITDGKFIPKLMTDPKQMTRNTSVVLQKGSSASVVLTGH